jgi:hypothetical protein
MTLIVTHISRHGIVHASDSNLTSVAGYQAGQGQKTFEIPRLNAGLALAGTYSVGGNSMDIWMKYFIDSQPGNTLAEFAAGLRDALSQQMNPEEKANGTLMHLAGYAEQNGVYHPELWFIRNADIDPATGQYQITDQLQLSEDFWSRDCPQHNLMQAFQTGAYIFYFNGFAPGRITFAALQPIMADFFSNIWSNPNWNFRPPASISEIELLVKLFIQIISTVFQFSDYSAPLIGGDAQTYVIPQPERIASAYGETTGKRDQEGNSVG